MGGRCQYGVVSNTNPVSVLFIFQLTKETKMLVKLKQLSVPPGERVLLKDVNWQDFEAILAELG